MVVGVVKVDEDGIQLSEKSAPNPSRSELSTKEVLSEFSLLPTDDDGDDDQDAAIIPPPSDMTSLARNVLQSLSSPCCESSPRPMMSS